MSEEEAKYEAPQAEEPAPLKRRARPVTVKVIESNKQAALVQWTEKGKLCRAYVPAESVQNGTATDLDLEASTPYGAEWESIVSLDPTPAAIASALRDVGVWTFEDMAMNRKGVESAILKLLRDEISDWIRTAKEAAHG